MSIVGLVDIGYKATAAATYSNGTTINTAPSASNALITGNNSGTSALKFIGTEDLGGGMKAGFLAEINPNMWQSSVAETEGTFRGTFNGTPFNGEQFLSLSGGFGEVKLGVPNAGFFGVAMSAGPFGTAMGSSYGTGGSRLGTVAPGVVSGINSASARIVRHERSVQYTTPAMNGFTATVDYAAANNNSVTNPANAATGSAATASANTDGYTSLTLRYGNGPLNVGFSTATVTVGTNGVQLLGTSANTGSPQGTTAIAYDGSYTYNILAGNYNFGATTAYAGYTTTKSSGNVAPEDASSWNLAVKHSIGALDLLGNYLVRNSNLDPAKAYGYGLATTSTGATTTAFAVGATTAFINGPLANNYKLIGAGADYNLSKRTALYARYEFVDANTDGKDARAALSATTGVTGGSITTATAIGIRHTF